MDIIGLLNQYKYQILILLVIILLWKFLAQNIFLILFVCCFCYFIYYENTRPINNNIQEEVSPELNF
jgi:hypothetical protein